MDFEVIHQSIKSRIDKQYPPDESMSKMANVISSQALTVTIECLKMYHEQLEQECHDRPHSSGQQ